MSAPGAPLYCRPSTRSRPYPAPALVKPHLERQPEVDDAAERRVECLLIGLVAAFVLAVLGWAAAGVWM